MKIFLFREGLQSVGTIWISTRWMRRA